MPIMWYRPKWDLDCSQKRVSIKLRNQHAGNQDLKKMNFSAKFERGSPVRRKTHCAPTQFCQKTAIQHELDSQPFRNTEDPLMVGDIFQDHLTQPLAGFHNPFLMASPPGCDSLHFKVKI